MIQINKFGQYSTSKSHFQDVLSNNEIKFSRSMCPTWSVSGLERTSFSTLPEEIFWLFQRHSRLLCLQTIVVIRRFVEKITVRLQKIRKRVTDFASKGARFLRTVNYAQCREMLYNMKLELRCSFSCWVLEDGPVKATRIREFFDKLKVRWCFYKRVELSSYLETWYRMIWRWAYYGICTSPLLNRKRKNGYNDQTKRMRAIRNETQSVPKKRKSQWTEVRSKRDHILE